METFMPQSDDYEHFQERIFQQIADLEAANSNTLIEQFKKSHGLGKEDTVALWTLDLNGPEFVVSAEHRLTSAENHAPVRQVTAIAVVGSAPLCELDEEYPND
jgi:hypothetical protein